MIADDCQILYVLTPPHPSVSGPPQLLSVHNGIGQREPGALYVHNEPQSGLYSKLYSDHRGGLKNSD